MKARTASQSRKRQSMNSSDSRKSRRVGQTRHDASPRVGPTHTTASTSNVFADLGFSPEQAENLRIRSDLMTEAQRLIAGMTQAEAAASLGVSQPRISALARGQIDRFTIDSLVNMLARGGMRTRVTVAKRRRPAA